MPRIVASFLIVVYCFAAIPVWARLPDEKRGTTNDALSSSKACDRKLVDRIRDLHVVVLAMGAKAHDAGQYALHLHRTSRWVGYKHVEAAVRDVEDISKTTLHTIADLSFYLDTLPDDESKVDAVTLAAVYENAVTQILDYAHVAADYERTQNSFMAFFKTRMTLTYSTDGSQPLRNYWDTITRHHLDERFTEVGDALRSLEIPEHLYVRSCAPATPMTNAATQNDPCPVSAIAALHATVTRMGEEAQDAGRTSRDLHATTLSRPYRRVERDWTAMSEKAEPTLDKLANLALRLNDAPDSDKKVATLTLVAAYQNAVEQYIDYAHYATYYERAENEAFTNTYGFMLGRSGTAPGGFAPDGGVLGMPFAPLGSIEPDTRAKLGFGLMQDSVKSNQQSTAMNLFEAKYTEADDALRSLKLPEYRFSQACGTPAPVLSIAPLADPCSANGTILGLRAGIVRLGDEVRDMDASARRLHRTSRSRPYKYIEREWIDVKTRSSPLLDTLSDLLAALDAAPDDAKKQAAADLTHAYQTSLKEFIDSGHLAVYYERAENSLSQSFYHMSLNKLNFGVNQAAPRNGGDITARDYLESKVLQPNAAFRSLKLPEYRYAKLCKIALSPIKISRVGER